MNKKNKHDGFINFSYKENKYHALYLGICHNTKNYKLSTNYAIFKNRATVRNVEIYIPLLKTPSNEHNLIKYFKRRLK